MRNASGHQSKNERQRKKVNRTTSNISSRRVTRKFLDVSRCRGAKQRQRNAQKSVLQVQSCFFLLVRPTVFLAVFDAVTA